MAFLTTEDLVMLSSRLQNLRDAVDTENYAVLNEWGQDVGRSEYAERLVQGSIAHQPIWTFLSKLDIAVGLFQGSGDINVPIAGVRKLEETARKAGKTKMEFHYFDNLDHSLNIIEYFFRGTLPAGHKRFLSLSRADGKK